MLMRLRIEDRWVSECLHDVKIIGTMPRYGESRNNRLGP